MGKTATNISVILGLITIAFGGYYLYTTNAVSFLGSTVDEATIEQKLANTRVFIERRRALDQLTINDSIGILEDERFRTLRSFSTPIEPRDVGRNDPFDVPVRRGGVPSI